MIFKVESKKFWTKFKEISYSILVLNLRNMTPHWNCIYWSGQNIDSVDNICLNVKIYWTMKAIERRI